MDKVYISEISKFEDKEVTLNGWLYNKRSSGKLRFLLVRDGTETIQCVVFKNDVSEEDFNQADAITQESSCQVTGIVKKDKRSSIGYELQVKSFKTLQLAEEYPISKKEHGVDFLMDHRHLWLRSTRQHAIFMNTQCYNACRRIML